MKKLLLSILITFTCIISAKAAGHVVSITTSSNATCFGVCNGSVTASVSGGVGPFTYSWSSGGSSATETGICAGNDTVYCTDNSDMSVAIAIVTITQPSLLTVGASGGMICGSGCTPLSPIASGGTPPYTYSWSGGLFGGSPTACPASTTTYTVTIADQNGCVATSSSTVTVYSLPAVTVNSPTICAGVTATLTGSGASFYNWSTGATTVSINVSPAATTTYTVTGTAPTGCTSTAVSTVTVVPAVIVTLPPSYTVCSGSVVCLSASATGGALTYSWSPATGLSSVTIANPCAAPMGTITYTVTVSNGTCTGTATTTVYVDGPITSGITSTNATGCATCDGTASLSPSGGTPPYFSSWGTTTITGICPGTYVGTITDANGCTVTDSTTIFANNDAIANFTMVPDSTNPYNFFAFNSSTGTGNAYDWSWGDGSPNATTANPFHTWGSIGVMTVCLTASNFLCGADTLCQTVNVTGVPASCLALFNIADDTLNPDPNAHYVYNLSYGATLTYLWDFGDGTTSTSMTPSHVYSGTGPYLLCLSVDNGAGCTDMFCDSLISADSLNRSSGTMQLVVYDLPTFYSVATGIDNAIATDNVKVAPNPFNETTIFTVNSNKIYSFELTDVLGKKVKSKNGISEKQFEISRDGLENGIYFYKVYTSEGVVGIGKVVIK